MHCTDTCRALIDLSWVCFLTFSSISSIDRDGDKALTLAEFVSLPEEDAGNIENLSKNDEWIRERKKEFIANIDFNKDGVASLEELEVS